MSDEIVFYTHPMSRGRIVHFMLEELGVPYRLEILDFQKMEQKQPAYLAINPMGKVPAIVHRGVVITEAAAICVYLADAFPEAQLAPSSDDPKRGTYLRWIFFGAGCAEPAMTDKLLARPAVERPSALGYGTYDDTVNALEAAITPGPYVLGDAFSAADVLLGSQVGWGLAVRALEPRPALVAYATRIAERPANKRMQQQCDALLARMKQPS